MLLKPAFTVALLSLGSVSFSAPVAQAEEHIVIILECVFFPQKIAVKQGDTVRFVNESDHVSTVFHTKGKWATPPLAAGEELLVTIEPEMTGAFHAHTSKRINGQLDLLRSGVTN